jgi:LysR family pca operon transcriptional activator
MRHIRCFLAVARHGTVTSAAAQLNSSQPAVSRSLSELERLVRQTLFVRTGRGLELTADGARLRQHLAAAMSQIEAGARLSGAHEVRRRVSVGILPNVARTLSVTAAAAFKKREPEVAVELHGSNVPELIARLQQGRIDFILGRLLGLEHMDGVSFEHLYAEPIIFVVSKAHPFAARAEEVTLADIRDELILVPLSATIIRRELDKFLTARGLKEFSNSIETVSFEFCRAFLSRVPAIACLPLGAVRAEIADGRLVRLGIQGEELVSSVGISYATGRPLSPEAQHFADEVRQASREFGRYAETGISLPQPALSSHAPSR